MKAPSDRRSIWLVACSLPARSIKLSLLMRTTPSVPGARRGVLGVCIRRGVEGSEMNDEEEDKGSSRDSMVWRMERLAEHARCKQTETHHLEDAVRARAPLVEVGLPDMAVLGTARQERRDLRFTRDDFFAQWVDEKPFLRVRRIVPSRIVPADEREGRGLTFSSCRTLTGPAVGSSRSLSVSL